MMNPATTCRKRSRPQSLQMPLACVTFALLFLVSQATALTGTAALTSEAPLLSNDSIILQKVEGVEYDEDEIDEWDEDEEWEDEDEEYDDDEEEYDDDEEWEDDWTPEEYEEMDLLFEKYLEEISNRYGDDWEQKFELTVDKEEIYEQYLEFEERKQERREMIEASHKALMQHTVVDERNFVNQNRTDDAASVLPFTGKLDFPSRTHMVVFNMDKNTKSNECPATTTIVTTQNTHTVLGSI